MIRSAAVVMGLAVVGVLSATGPARADTGQLTAVMRGADPLAPSVRLTNHGGDACQVAVTPLGTVALTRVEQGGAVVQPIVSYPAFDERLDVTVTSSLRTLTPGASQVLKLPMIAGGPTGHLIETVSWSRSTGPVALLYPVRAGQALNVDLSYGWGQDDDGGTPLCGAAAATAGPAPAAPTAPRITPAAAEPESGWHGFALVAVVILGLGVLLAVLLPVFLLLRRQRTGTYLVLVLLAAATMSAVRSAPARAADLTPDPRIEGAFGDCLATFQQHDPAGLLPVLQDPNFHVQIAPSTRDSHEGGIPGGAFVFWDPNDTSPLTGPGGNGTGPARIPCATLYHELFHAMEDAQGGRSNFECVTDAGRSGIGTGEVNATRAENALRQALGQPVRTVYGGVALPSGECHPRDPGDRFCTENAAGPMCTCRTATCSESTGDPHLLTWDGRRYDFQAAGEFVAARDPAGGYQLQVRQQPWPGRRDVAVNTAIAMDVAGDKVEVDAGPDAAGGGDLTVLVNGADRGSPAGALPKGGAITVADSGLGQLVGIGWPDGSAVAVSPISDFGISYTASVAPARAGKLEGLLGNADGVPADDVRVRRGAVLDDPSFERLYPAFADSWRVTDAGSLFSYPVGVGTETYTDHAFPERAASGAGVPNRAAAMAICQAYGVTDPAVLDGCVVDVALTGQPEFATTAAYGQQVSGRTAAGTPFGLAASADIYQCGTGAVGDLPGGSGTAPQRVPVPAGTTSLRFPDVSGKVGAAGTAQSGPDGDPGWGGTDIPATNGLSGIHHNTQALFPVGVFLPVPGSPAATDDVTTADQTQTVAPLLGQLFEVGDGKAADGTTQTFTVPAGATTLCLGFADANGFKGSPGYFNDNVGSLSVTYQLS